MPRARHLLWLSLSTTLVACAGARAPADAPSPTPQQEVTSGDEAKDAQSDERLDEQQPTSMSDANSAFEQAASELELALGDAGRPGVGDLGGARDHSGAPDRSTVDDGSGADAHSRETRLSQPSSAPVCSNACRALGSMQRAARRFCELADDDSQCDTVTERVERARERVASACPSCASASS